MYFPYLRGKQGEIFAVRNSALFPNRRIVPVFEPIDLSDTYVKKYAGIASKGTRFSVIVNSGNGKSKPPEMSEVFRLLDDIESHTPGVAIPAFEIRANEASIDRLDLFASRFSSVQCILVHRAQRFSGTDLTSILSRFSKPAIQIFLDGHIGPEMIDMLPATGKVLLRDGFDIHSPNKNYPRQTTFNNSLYRYRDLGFNGFSDFSIIGDHYSSGRRSNANHVALHLTEYIAGKSAVTNHFVTSPDNENEHIRKKYLDALEQMMEYTGQPPDQAFATEGMLKYHETYSQEHFPGLGKPKQWSTMHHMEITYRELEAMSAEIFI